MFDLEAAITNWRRQMRAGGLEDPAVLDELEAHLREEVAPQLGAGDAPAAVFARAVRQLGQPQELKQEFDNAGETSAERLKRWALVLFGVPQSQLATSMNAPTPYASLEPRWATYFKGLVFALPATLVWGISMIFLMPKLQQICQHAGTVVFNFESAPAVFQAAARVARGLVFLTPYSLLLLLATLALFGLLEWRSDRWPRFRRAAIGGVVFLMNVAVLVSVMLMVVSALLAIPSFPAGR